MPFTLKRLVFVLPVVCLLAACGKGLDRKLDTAGNDDAFNASFWAANKDMTADDKNAWSWAVQDLSINDIRSKYPDATLRQVIRGEARAVLANSEPRIKELEASKPLYDAKLQKLEAITATNVSFSPSKNGSRVLEFDLHNGSQLPVSHLEWKAWLYINDDKDPVTTAWLYDDFTQGLAVNASEHHQYTDADIIGSGWDTLAVRNAKSRRVVVEVTPESVKDFSANRYMSGAPYGELERLHGWVDTATRYVQY